MERRLARLTWCGTSGLREYFAFFFFQRPRMLDYFRSQGVPRGRLIFASKNIFAYIPVFHGSRQKTVGFENKIGNCMKRALHCFRAQGAPRGRLAKRTLKKGKVGTTRLAHNFGRCSVNFPAISLRKNVWKCDKTHNLYSQMISDYGFSWFLKFFWEIWEVDGAPPKVICKQDDCVVTKKYENNDTFECLAFGPQWGLYNMKVHRKMYMYVQFHSNSIRLPNVSKNHKISWRPRNTSATKRCSSAGPFWM